MRRVTTSQKCTESRSLIVALEFHVGCSSTAERRAVNAETTSSILASQPNPKHEPETATTKENITMLDTNTAAPKEVTIMKI